MIGFWPIAKNWKSISGKCSGVSIVKLEERFRHLLHGFVPRTKNPAALFMRPYTDLIYSRGMTILSTFFDRK